MVGGGGGQQQHKRERSGGGGRAAHGGAQDHDTGTRASAQSALRRECGARDARPCAHCFSWNKGGSDANDSALRLAITFNAFHLHCMIVCVLTLMFEKINQYLNAWDFIDDHNNPKSDMNESCFFLKLRCLLRTIYRIKFELTNDTPNT